MSTTPSDVAVALAAAVAAHDLAGAAALVHDDVDFRAMTPSRIWEASGPDEVETVLRTWIDDRDEEVEGIEATAPVVVADVTRVGWVVRLRAGDARSLFEQQAYVRERAGRIAWLRIMCSGPRPQGAGPAG